MALNRVLGNSGTEIYGQLRANGQVFLTNPNGVLFAPGAKVDVGGLVASTLDLSQQDFADGRYVFNHAGGRGAVVNQGSLTASAGGYLVLFGNQVSNQGDIAVDAGSVVLASGRAATVSISGSGLLSAVVTPGRAGRACRQQRAHQRRRWCRHAHRQVGAGHRGLAGEQQRHRACQHAGRAGR